MERSRRRWRRNAINRGMGGLDHDMWIMRLCRPNIVGRCLAVDANRALVRIFMRSSWCTFANFVCDVVLGIRLIDFMSLEFKMDCKDACFTNFVRLLAKICKLRTRPMSKITLSWNASLAAITSNIFFLSDVHEHLEIHQRDFCYL